MSSGCHFDHREKSFFDTLRLGAFAGESSLPVLRGLRGEQDFRSDWTLNNPERLHG